MQSPSPIWGVLPRNEMKQQISLAYLRMVAATAGINVLDWSSDYEGVDTTVQSGAEFPARIGIKLDIQLKCTSSPNWTKDHLTHQLSRVRYEKLRHEKRLELAMLAVLVVPDDFNDWLDLNEERLHSKCCMYYALTNEWPLIDGDQDSKVVHLSKRDILDPVALNRAMEIAAERDIFSW